MWGAKYIENLKNSNVNTAHVQKTEGETSGIAQIIVSEAGENQIVIVAGANKKLSVSDVEKAQNEISTAAVVILQLETSVDVAIRAIQLTRGVRNT